jgi:hypothetical protein
MINMTLMWYFGIHLKYEIKGLWYAKLTMEYTVWLFYSVLVYCVSWEKVAKKAQERQEYEMV